MSTFPPKIQRIKPLTSMTSGYHEQLGSYFVQTLDCTPLADDSRPLAARNVRMYATLRQ